MAKGSRAALKWVGVFIGGFFALLILAAVLIPLFVDVDKFRPQIVDAANQQINGKVELGKLSLSLWGQIKVNVDGFTLSDSKNRKVVSVADVYFQVPFSSIFSGSPILTLRMKKPEVAVIKDPTGMNVLTLMKSQPKTAPVPATPEKPATTGTTELPAMARNARLGVDMRDARLAYKDTAAGLSSTVEALNVRIKDLSLSRPTELEVTAQLNTEMGTALSVKGPARLVAKAQPTFNGSEFQKATVEMKADVDGVEIRYGELFHKAKGVPMNVEGRMAATMTSATIEDMVARFHNVVLKMSGGVSGFGATTSPTVDFKVGSNAIDLAPWSELVPMLKAYALVGNASFEAVAKGPTDKLNYTADLIVKSLKAKAPMLKAQPEFGLVAKVVTDRLQSLNFTMRAPGNHLDVSGSVVSFTKPKVVFRATSTGLDLDQLVELPKSAKAEKPATGSSSGGSGAGTAPQSDFDAMLEPLRGNAIAAATDATFGFDLKFVKYMNIRMEPIQGVFSFRGLTAALDSFKMRVFDGLITSNAKFELKPKTPRYDFAVQVAGLDLKKAMASQMQMFKNTLYGIASFSMRGQGASFNPEPAMAALAASGNFTVLDGQFQSIDIGQVATDAVNKALQGLEAKVPQARGKSIKPPKNVGGGYERITSSFTIAKNVFTMPDFAAVAGRNKGIDVRGVTTVGMKDYKLDANWELVDTQNLTTAHDLSVDVSGVVVAPLLAEPGQPVKFPIKVTGTLFAPSPSYTSVPEALGRVAVANVARAVEARIKSEATAKLNAEKAKVEQKAASELKKVIPGLGKKFKF